MTATVQHIHKLLASRHSEDVLLTECKDGPTVGANHRRIDAWAMRRSWTRPCFWGYEVKVSRSDFLSDTKWQDYLPLCNELFFVCPWGLVQPAEMPGDVGLLWAAKQGSRLYTKKKATHREIVPPVDLLLYALMARTENGNGYGYRRSAEYWEAWLEKKKSDEIRGCELSGKLARRVDEEIEAVRHDYSARSRRASESGRC